MARNSAVDGVCDRLPFNRVGLDASKDGRNAYCKRRCDHGQGKVLRTASRVYMAEYIPVGGRLDLASNQRAWLETVDPV